MKILNATYPKFEDIPVEYQKLFEKKGDQYVLMDDAIEGAAALLNPGLEANRTRILDEKTKLETRVADAETAKKDAENKLKQIAAAPDSVLTTEDLKTWNKIKGLGDVNEVVKRFNEFPNLQKSVQTNALETTLSKVQKALNLPESSIEALRDTLENPKYGEGIEIKFKKVEVQKQDGSKEVVESPFFSKKTKTGENTFQESEHEIGKYVSENFPAYVASAISQQNNGGGENQNQNLQPLNNGIISNNPILGNQNQFSGVGLPILGSSGSQGNGGGGSMDAMKIAEQMNQARDTRQNPFAVDNGNQNTQNPNNNAGGAK